MPTEPRTVSEHDELLTLVAFSLVGLTLALLAALYFSRIV
jgi:hypothetical protein